MNTPEDFEKVARRLDGWQEALTPLQERLAEQIAQDQRRVGPALDVSLPADVLARVEARLAGAADRRRPRAVLTRRLGVAVAAAAVILAVVLLPARRQETPAPPKIAAADYLLHFLHVPGADLDARAELLSQEIANCHVEVALADNWPMELALSGLEQEMGQLLLEEDESVDTWD